MDKMLLYKFRSLQNIEFILDIILNDRLHCAHYNELNDPFEGVFHTIFYENFYKLPWTMPLTPTRNKVMAPNSVDNLFSEEAGLSRVCSLSKSLSDIRLWSHYADGHKGIAIAIDFPEGEAGLFEVKYVSELPEYGDSLLPQPSSTDVLSFKTKHWSYEEEYRIIQKDNFYSVAGNIKSIYAGHRISDLHLDLLKKLAPEHIQIVPTEINSKTISIQPKL